jgi:hypothetical protein
MSRDFCSFALIRSVRRGRIQIVAAFSCAKVIANLENSSVLLTGYTCYENHQYPRVAGDLFAPLSDFRLRHPAPDGKI